MMPPLEPPRTCDPRFTLELEFVLALGNPYYISHLAVTHPHLLGSSTSDNDETAVGSDEQAFAAYLEYLYSYWQRPEYMQFLTHPSATLRALRLLQQESFRHAVIRPQVIETLLTTGANDATEPDRVDETEVVVGNSKENEV